MRVHKNYQQAKDIFQMLKQKQKVAYLGDQKAYDNMKALVICLGATSEDLKYFTLAEPGKSDGITYSSVSIDPEKEKVYGKTYKML